MERNRKTSFKTDRCRITSLSNCSALDARWLDRYVEVTVLLNFGNFDDSSLEDLHHKILYDLNNELISEDVKLHLLTLLESASQLLTFEDEVEQTIGSLLNVIRSNGNGTLAKTSALRNKLLITSTMLMLEHYEWKYKSESINQLYLDVIRILIDLARSEANQTAIECLNEISSYKAGLFDEDIMNNIKSLSGQLYLASFINANQNTMELREFTQNITFQPNLRFYHLANKLFNVSNMNLAPEHISLIILKPFIIKFIMSYEVHNMHFILKLLIKYGFEIISSFEEEVFLKQLVILSTLNTLPIGSRLLYLSYIKICFMNIFKPPLNSPPLNLLNSLYPFQFDGPDTQEKKLMILNDFSFVINDDDYYKMLLNIYERSANEGGKSVHTTNSFFRLLHVTILNRANLVSKILELLLESIFSLSYKHYIPKLLTFLELHWEFAQNLVDKFIARLMIVLKQNEANTSASSSSTTTTTPFLSVVQSYSQYLSFLKLINWFLSIAHYNIRVTEFQLEFLVNFIFENSQQWPQSSNSALTCCTSILYYQRVTPKVKKALMNLLEWLRNTRKSDLETSSLAQIYLLALQTLDESYIKQVFTSDEEEFLITRIPENFETYLRQVVRTDQCDCPIEIVRVPIEQIIKATTTLPDRMSLGVCFEARLRSSASFERLFCVDMLFTSAQLEQNQLSQTFDIPIMERGHGRLGRTQLRFDIDFKVNAPFYLNIALKFIDAKGSIYRYHLKNHELITLEDLFIPIKMDMSEQYFQQLVEKTLEHEESLQTVINIKAHHSLETFFEEHAWFQKYFLADPLASENVLKLFLVGLCPDRIIIGNVKLVNDVVNLYVVTNHFEIIPSLYNKFGFN